MNVSQEQIQIERAVHSKPTIRLAVPFSCREGWNAVPGQATEQSFTESLAHGTSGTKITVKGADLDWTDESLLGRFAALERKVGKGEGNEEDIQRYQTLLRSRRAFIHAKSYLEDYMDEQRQKAITVKLQELKQLLRPARR